MVRDYIIFGKIEAEHVDNIFEDLPP